ncbi:unnamed protein product [Nyctereutes procyonoides]|uniref:(raccoon dog) hypothetical protein n=1 Tax=Nyctereutes procyonoides TaxID=34880 RepID=A0A811ZKY9_NYCPR|nr:unnamed protein product [Nyctereutes procyonoides]
MKQMLSLRDQRLKEKDRLKPKKKKERSQCTQGKRKTGAKYRVPLRIAKDPRFEQLPCTHKGTYADDCLVQRVTQHKCYIVATPLGLPPIMYISNHRYNIKWMPDDYGAPRF